MTTLRAIGTARYSSPGCGSLPGDGVGALGHGVYWIANNSKLSMGSISTPRPALDEQRRPGEGGRVPVTASSYRLGHSSSIASERLAEERGGLGDRGAGGALVWLSALSSMKSCTSRRSERS